MTEKEMHGTVTRRTFLKASSLAGAGVLACFGAGCSGALSESDGAEESDKLSDTGNEQRIRSHCRACGKHECGTWVTVRDGRVVSIEGDETARTSRGNLCAKGKAAIQALYHPDRVRYPMRRTNPKGEDPGWERISWDEALATSAENFNKIKEQYGPESIKILHGTGRVTTYAHEGWGDLLGTPNGGSTAGQVCKGPRFVASAATCYPGAHFVALTDGQKSFIQWGTGQEVSNYDNAGRVVVDAQAGAEGTGIVGPRMQNLGKEADVWVNIRPGTDDVIAMTMLNLIVNEMKTYDVDFVKRWTNGAFLWSADIEPSGFDWQATYQGGTYPLEIKTRLVKESDMVEGGSPKKFAAWDNVSKKVVLFNSETMLWEGEAEYVMPTETTEVAGGVLAEDPGFGCDIDPALEGTYDVTLKDGTTVSAQPAFQIFADSLKEWTPEKAAEVAWTDAQKIRDLTELYASETGRGGIQFQLAIEHAGNSIQCSRALFIMSGLMGNLDTPGGNRGHEGMYYQYGTTFPNMVCFGVEDLAPEQRAKIAGVEKFPLMPWINSIGGTAKFYDNTTATEMVFSGDPYPIRAMMSNTGQFFHSANAVQNWEAIKSLDFYMGTELWFTPTIELADIVLPANHFLENGCIRYSQNAECGLGAMVPIVEPFGETRWDNEALIQLAQHMGMPWWFPVPEACPPWWPEEYKDVLWPNAQQMRDIQLLPSKLGMGEPGPKGETLQAVDWDDFVNQYQEKGQWSFKDISPLGYYRRWLWGHLRQDKLPGFLTPTGRFEILSTIFESYQPGEELPCVREPRESPYSTPEVYEEYPIVFTTGKRNPVYFHSEHRQLPFCRERGIVPTFQINPETAAQYGIEDGDWCWIESRRGKIRQVADVFYGIAPGVIEAEHAWWYPELSAPEHGWRLSNVNVLTDEHAQDPICGSTTLRGYLVKVYKATPENSPFNNPIPCDDDGTEIITTPDDPRMQAWMPLTAEEVAAL